MIRSKRALVAVFSVLALGAGSAASTASAHAAPARLVVKSSAAYLGMTPREVRQALRGGQSLAALATARTAQGKSVDGLKAAILSAVTTRVNRAVAAGRRTAAQAQQILARFAARLDRIVNRTRTPRP